MVENFTTSEQSELIGQIYACATDVGLWPTTLASLTTRANDSHAPQSDFSVEQTDTSYRFARSNAFGAEPLASSAKTLAPSQWLVAVEGTHAEGLTAISIAHGRRSGAFASNERVALDRLAPHVVRAFRLQRRLHGIAFFTDALSNVLDYIDYGVVLLDERARVVLANRAAIEFASQRDGLRLKSEGISATTEADRLTLQRAVRAALAAGLGTSLPIARNERSPMFVTVVPLASETSLPVAARAAVFIVDSLRSRCVPTETLRSLFGLTQAECRVATSLVTTHRIAETAATLGIAFETGRSHLKRIFEKTGTSRLSELVRLHERLGTVAQRATEPLLRQAAR